MDKGLIWGALAISGIAVLAILVVGVRRIRLTREETIIWKTRVSRKSRLTAYFHRKLCLAYILEVIVLHSFVDLVFKDNALPAMLDNGFALLEARIFLMCVLFLIAAMLVLLHLAILIPIIRRILTSIPTENSTNEKGQSL